jgi:Protein of unknown function (DUF3106)
MTIFRATLVPLLAVVLLTPAFAGQRFAQQGSRRTAGQAARPKAQPGVQQRPAQQRQAQPNNHPGEQILRGLATMTPEEREKALSRLPPAQRANIEKRIENFQQLPPATQARRLERLDRLNNLPQQRQNEVRRSMNQMQKLPDDRRMAINRELGRMTKMTDDERQEYMNTEEFRNRFSPDEQRIARDLAEIQPTR